MIKIRIRHDDHEIDVRFPISESELFAKLGEIHAVEGRDAAQSALVTEVYWPEEFSMLKDRFANLDELNYLGKRIRSLENIVARILEELQEFFPELLETFDVQLVLDGDTLVAEMTPKIDRELGAIRKRKERG